MSIGALAAWSGSIHQAKGFHCSASWTFWGNELRNVRIASIPPMTLLNRSKPFDWRRLVASNRGTRSRKQRSKTSPQEILRCVEVAAAPASLIEIASSLIKHLGVLQRSSEHHSPFEHGNDAERGLARRRRWRTVQPPECLEVSCKKASCFRRDLGRQVAAFCS